MRLAILASKGSTKKRSAAYLLVLRHPTGETLKSQSYSYELMAVLAFLQPVRMGWTLAGNAWIWGVCGGGEGPVSDHVGWSANWQHASFCRTWTPVQLRLAAYLYLSGSATFRQRTMAASRCACGVE